MERSAKKKVTIGAPAWVVTFADLMSLLVCFFVLIISFSIIDELAVQVVAGSMRDAFGLQKDKIVTGVVERDGTPFFNFQRILRPNDIPMITMAIPSSESEPQDADFSDGSSGDDRGQTSDEHQIAAADDASKEDELFEQAERFISEAVKTAPDLRELADNLKVEQTPEGLRIQLVDQEKEPMFPRGSSRMFLKMTPLLALVVAAVEPMPNSLSISGHTDGLPYRYPSRYNNWDLSSDRANATRQILVSLGLDESRVASVVGKADTQPLFPDDPLDPRNRRISIVVLRQQPAAAAAAEVPEGAPSPGTLQDPAETTPSAEQPG